MRYRIGIYLPALPVLLAGLFPPLSGAEAQLTSSRTVAILPFVSSSSDSALAANMYEQFVTTLAPSIASRGIRIELSGQGLERRELAEKLSETLNMGGYARDIGAAFLLGGGIARNPGGELFVSVILYGADDRRIIALEQATLEDETAAIATVQEMAGRLSRPRVLTSSDTPIVYSIVIPGTGQIMVGEPVHALLCSGLVTAAFLYKRGPQPMPSNPDMAAKLKKAIKRERIKRIVMAWLFNVADTTLLCKLKVRRVDASLFLSMMEDYSRFHVPDFHSQSAVRGIDAPGSLLDLGHPAAGDRIRPVIGLTINFNFRR